MTAIIPAIGHYALALAFALSLIQALVPAWGAQRNNVAWMRLAPPVAIGQFVFVLLAYVALTWSFVVNDFSVAYVATNSNTSLPLMYRIAAVWGAHEGSLLLWVLILAGWTLAVVIASRSLPLSVSSRVIAVMGAISAGFLLFMLGTSNPFDRLIPAALEGRDLNPLLQDPGLVIHPPMLYMGYVGFSVAFAFAIAALLSGRLDTAWARWTRPWTTSAWLFLTIGIMLGSWWAYNELGWGGWWFWDPVENASFMPWLVGTALIHSLAVTEKRGALKSWTVLLAITAFSLSLLGTFLVRSGVLVSVHAFATDPARGVFILGFMVVVVGGSLLLYAVRAADLKSDVSIALGSREGLLLINNLFLLTAAAAVFLGTLYPLAVDALGGGKLSVGPPYFNAVFVPLTLPLVVLAGIMYGLPWKRARWRAAFKKLRIPMVAAIVIGVLLPWVAVGRSSIVVAAACVVGTWVIAGSLYEIGRRIRSVSSIGRDLRKVPASAWGMATAHLGMGVFVLGVSVTSAFSTERDVRMAPGDRATLGNYEFVFRGTQPYAGPNYDADRGELEIYRDDRRIAALHPEKRIYRAQGNPMTEAGVDWNLSRDLYVSLGESLGDGAWSLRLHVKPFMRLVWLGFILMALGAALSVSDRRYRLRAS